ncbi:unnamed protein product [Cuscuta campestris]|uniref:Uncharacterized protein n=1 Tax=Cuscuta campestris TaxID=132261 RepID=A0A484NA60_9ASTE|nr:unnamed protein product [Cuscuta campestris]
MSISHLCVSIAYIYQEVQRCDYVVSGTGFLTRTMYKFCCLNLDLILVLEYDRNGFSKNHIIYRTSMNIWLTLLA